MAAKSKYGSSVLRKAQQYVNEYESHGDPLPSISGLARLLGVTRMSIHRWKNDEDKPEWSEMMDALLCEQERQLLNKGLRGEFNATICRLLLGGLGYRERMRHEHTGRDGGPIQQITSDMSDEEVKRRYLQMLHGHGGEAA